MNQSTQGSFQKIFMIVGFVLGVAGIFVFSVSQFGGSDVDPALTGNIVVWGTLPADQMRLIFGEYSQLAKTYSVTYEEIPEAKFIDRFIEASANERAPDILLTPENITVPLRMYAYPFTQQFITEKYFKDNFARSTYKFFGATSVYGFPVAIDPLVMYVNTDILTNAGFTKAPQTWGEIPLYVSRVLGFTNADKNNVQRAIALGTVTNVIRSREVLLSLLLQLKNDVILRTFTEKSIEDPETGQSVLAYDVRYESVFGLNNEETKQNNDRLAEEVFVFFTSFVNPSIKEAYTWSKKAPVDRDLFASGNLGLFFGLASDKKYIDAKNPNLNYELEMVPSPKGPTSSFRYTSYARVYTVSLIAKTRKPELAQKVLGDLYSKELSDKIILAYGLAPARQADLYVEQKDPELDVIYRSADRGDIVLEPIPNLIKNIFSDIVDAFSGSRQTPSEIIKNADAELVRALKAYE